MFMYKIKYKLVPHSCLHFATVNNINRIHITRRFCYFAQIYFRTNIRVYSFSVQGAKLWNCLPLNIQNKASLGIFKHKLVDHYISTYWSKLATLLIYFLIQWRRGGVMAYCQYFLNIRNDIIHYLLIAIFILELWMSHFFPLYSSLLITQINFNFNLPVVS